MKRRTFLSSIPFIGATFSAILHKHPTIDAFTIEAFTEDAGLVEQLPTLESTWNESWSEVSQELYRSDEKEKSYKKRVVEHCK